MGPRALSLFLLAFVTACGGKLDPSPGSAIATPAHGGSSDHDITGPWGIECEVFYKPATSDKREIFSTTSDATETRTLEFPGATVQASIAPSASVPGEVLLALAFDQALVSQTFRLARDRPPGQTFAGNHGFSGLVYVGEDIQYICRATTKTESGPPPEGRDARERRVPLDVSCRVEARSKTNGSLVESQTIDVTTPGDRLVVGGGVNVNVAYNDSRHEGRSLILDLVKPGASGTSLRQLLQIDGGRRLDNHLGGTFTGTLSLAPDRANDVLVDCLSR